MSKVSELVYSDEFRLAYIDADDLDDILIDGHFTFQQLKALVAAIEADQEKGS